MNEFDFEEKPRVNFYKLDKGKPYKTVYEKSTYKHYKFLLGFAVVFLALIVGFVIYGLIFNPQTFSGSFAFLAPVFFAVIGAVFLGLGIKYRNKYKQQQKAVDAVIENCTLTDGCITAYQCTEHMTHDSDGTSRSTYRVDMEYSFYDKDYNLRTANFSNTYSTEPQFYRGQYLMIAFNETDSVILTEFTLDKSDEQNFLANEEMRSADDFDGLTGELLSVDLKRPIKDYNYSGVRLMVALVLFVIVLAYTIPVSIFAAPQYTAFDTAIPDLLVLLLLYIMPVIFIAVIIWLFVSYYKSTARFKKIMHGKPLFTYGKMFASEKTYRGGANKNVFYCYIDKWGERHTEAVTSQTYRTMVQDETVPVIVAYTASGESTVILKCALTDEE